MILDSRGVGLAVPQKPKTPIAQIAKRTNGRDVIKASYDAARDGNQLVNYWANADNYDSDSANSFSVRKKLVARSRYETSNNGYTDGIIQSYTAFVCGLGPQLRMRSTRPGFNQLVERRWKAWCKAVGFRRKLNCMTHAKIQDGETFAMLVNNSRVGDKVELDLVPFETEMCHSPGVVTWKQGHIDGIHFDEFGNPIYYDILRQHPGGSMAWYALQEPMRVPSKYVLHWFNLRRPGQHRGIPELTSTLNCGANARRFREATIAAAETAANFSAVIKTQMMPDDEEEAPAAFSTTSIDKNMMTALPKGYDLGQMKAEHPTTTYDSFNSSQISEQARPLGVPRNLAMCDSSKYNFASGKLDQQAMFQGIDIVRADCEEIILDRTFAVWFERARLVYGWGLAGEVPDHSWDWPKHPVADVKSMANAQDTNLRNGSASLSGLMAESGIDFEDHLNSLATDYGVTVEEMREILLKNNLSGGMKQESVDPEQQQQDMEEQGLASTTD